MATGETDGCSWLPTRSVRHGHSYSKRGPVAHWCRARALRGKPYLICKLPMAHPLLVFCFFWGEMLCCLSIIIGILIVLIRPFSTQLHVLGV